FFELEELLVAEIVLCADPFFHLAVHLPPGDLAPPGLLERALILDHHGRFERVSVVDELPTLDHVEVLGVRRRIVVEHAVAVLEETDRVDHKLAVLIAADGFTVPARRWLCAVLAIEPDAPDMMIARPDDADFVGALHEIDGLGDEDQLPRSAARPTAGLRGERVLTALH